jgi:hypothetical protein
LCDYITCQKFPPIKKNFPCPYYKAFMVVIKVQDAGWLVTLRHFYPSLIFLRKGRTSQSVPTYGDNEAVIHQMAVPVPSISCCVLNHHNLFYQMQSVLAFNWDMCCHLALCLRLLPFHSFGRVLLEKGRKLMGENSSHIFNSRCGHACLSNVITPTQNTV